MNSAIPFERVLGSRAPEHSAANDDHAPEIAGGRTEVAAGAGWDPFDVWRRRVRDPRRAAERAADV